VLEEALKYAELYPEDDSLGKNRILLYCLSGDEQKLHIQKMLRYGLYTLTDRLDNYETLQSRKLQETLIKLFFEDENYLEFHALLFQCFKSQAYYLAQEKRSV
jgi:hypothetical protein